MKPHLLLSVIGMIIATCTAFSSQASPIVKVCPTAGRCGDVNSVSDEQLAGIAGKFSIAGEIVGMRLSLLSSWQAAGQSMQASATWSIDLPTNGDIGHFRVQANAGGSEGNLPTNVNSVDSGLNERAGRGTLNGISQIVQVAGDGNGAVNRVAVAVSTENMAPPPESNVPFAAYRAADGSLARVSIDGNSASLELSMANGTGTASQDINRFNNSIRQNIQIASDQQNVTNELRLQLQIYPSTNLGLAEQGFARSLGAIHGR